MLVNVADSFFLRFTVAQLAAGFTRISRQPMRTEHGLKILAHARAAKIFLQRFSSLLASGQLPPLRSTANRYKAFLTRLLSLKLYFLLTTDYRLLTAGGDRLARGKTELFSQASGISRQ